ncbi:glycosyltransferase family 10 [Parvibaculum sp.]|uniref:glycosyltransferase family 10 domain-containing protein n=1 Tax=Parvibaculum sp. TaxID=2024848 RepID=UPI000C93AF38|nr:glycosyltransferase family 10 [Parvibaculum sp.]MAB15371.1 hypothetical protein [Parvibaculum sp.]
MRLKLALRDVYSGYVDSLVPTVIRAVCGGSVDIVPEDRAELVIVGPFRKKRGFFEKLKKSDRNRNATYLFHTGENVRRHAVPADFSISFDLGVDDDTHLRWPLWTDSLVWRERGIVYEPENGRFGGGIEIERLLEPLGPRPLEREFRAAIFSWHLNEPRGSLIEALSSVMEVDGFGRAFDKSIASHDSSGFYKYDVLQRYMFNLCPENSLYPGYYTEKIVEAYAAGCIPIGWADPNLDADFNAGALINSLPFAKAGYAKGMAEAVAPEKLRRLVEVPLLDQAPSLEPLVRFIGKVVRASR